MGSPRPQDEGEGDQVEANEAAPLGRLIGFQRRKTKSGKQADREGVQPANASRNGSNTLLNV
jgi:hypothetical protein